jgi:LysR family cys regulon transcriptional activator
VVRDFRALYPKVTLNLHQGSPRQVAEMLLSGEADIGVATRRPAYYEQLVALPCYRWIQHPGLARPPSCLGLPGLPALSDLARYPIITYESGYTGRTHIDEAFARAGLEPNIVLTAMDANAIKTYVELGMGMGIIASIAFDSERDLLVAGHRRSPSVRGQPDAAAIRRGTWLRGYADAFVEAFAATLTRAVVERALAGETFRG